MKTRWRAGTWGLACMLALPAAAEDCPALRSIQLPLDRIAGKDGRPIALRTGEGVVALRAGRTDVNVDGSPRAYHPDGGYTSLCNGYDAWWPDKRLVCAENCDACDRAFQHALREQRPPFSGEVRFRLFGFEGRDGLPDPEGKGGYFIGRKAGGRTDGAPNVQAHGYYISTTAITLADGEGQAKYLSSEHVPSIVMPGGWSRRFPEAAYGLGDLVYVFDPDNPERGTAGIVGDTGPEASFGEASLAMHVRLHGREWVEPPLPDATGYRQLDCDSLQPPLACTRDAPRKIRATRNYGNPLVYVIFPSTRPECLRSDNPGCLAAEFSVETIDRRAGEAIARLYGDRDRLRECMLQAFR